VCGSQHQAGGKTVKLRYVWRFTTAEEIYACFETIREQNLRKRILLVLDNFSSHICECTRKRAHDLDIDLVFFSVGSPQLNPIESVWKSLKWESSPLIADGEDEYRALLDDIFGELTEQLSFAASWTDNHLSGFFSKLS
jgi:transposase